METIKTEHKTTIMNYRGTGSQMKEVICKKCSKRIRFAFTIPRFCPDCFEDVSVPWSLFRGIQDRIDHYRGIKKNDYY